MANAPQEITQETVNRLYGELYDKIQTAQAAAKAQGKHITILLGDIHDSLNSCFLETMIFDICERLGIKRLGVELDRATLNKYARSLSTIGKDLLVRMNKANTDFLKKLYLSADADNFASSSFRFKPEEEEEQWISMFKDGCSRAFGLTAVPCDPMRRKRDLDRSSAKQGIDQTLPPTALEVMIKARQIALLANDEVEQKMAEEVTKWANKGDLICSNGAIHVPYLSEAMEKASFPVLPIYCLAGDNYLKMMSKEFEDYILRQGVANNSEVVTVSARLKHFNPLNGYAPDLPPEPQIPLGVGMRMMLVASTDHQRGRGEISDEVAEERLELIKKYQDIAKAAEMRKPGTAQQR